MRVCSTPGCPTLYPTTGGSRCPAHRRQADQARRHDGNPYSTRGHRNRFRPGVLNRDPICTLCNTAQSTIADHHPLTRTELIEHSLDPNDPDHGRGLCKPCHDSHTATTTPGGWHTPG